MGLGETGMENWQTFIQEQWLVVLIAFVVIGAIVKMVKTVLKWVLTAVIVVVLFTYATQYNPNLVEDAKNLAASTVKEQAVKLLEQKAAENGLEFTSEADGSYVVSGKGVQLKGTAGSNDVQVSYLGQTITLPLDKTLQLVVDQAKAQSQAQQ